jgi:hypothetical protein
MIATTATTIGTTGPTLAANPIAVIPLNTQSTLDVPYEFMEELMCAMGQRTGSLSSTSATPSRRRTRSG